MGSTTKNTSLGKVKTKTPSPTTPTQRADKEKIRTPSSATHSNETSLGQGRRTPTKPAVTRSSSGKGLAVSSDKATPNYLKGTASSVKDATTKIPRKQASDDTSLKYSTSRRQSMDKPPSPAQLKRTLSSSPKERRLTTPSPPPKKTVSPKPAAKTPPTKTEKSQPFKPANIKKCATTTPRAKRDSKPSSAASTPTPSSPDTDDNAVVKPQVDDKVAPVKEIHVQPVEVVEEVVPVQVQSSPTHDQAATDVMATDTSEEPQVVTKTPAEENDEPHNQVEENIDMVKQEEEEEEEKIIQEENPTPAEESEAQYEANVEVKEGEDDSVKNENSAEITSPSEETQASDDRQVGKEAEINGGKTESQNVVLKRQDTQGKRESPAYNNVIEETASKLVQKRKGKVLALVGAFETVINLESDNQQNEGA